MPVVNVEGPKIADIERKRQMVVKLTAVVAEIYGMPVEAITVHIRENNPENVGVGGQLVADRRKG